MVSCLFCPRPCIAERVLKYIYFRLLEFAPFYFDLKTFPDSEMKRVLQRSLNKKLGGPVARSDSRNQTRKGTPKVDEREAKRRRKE
jgi:pre-mRNA-splicing factor ATP-dependent RNA helicase DHX15/PRP43